MDRFPTPQLHDRTHSQAPGAAGDGLAQGMVYTAIVRAVPSRGLVAVSIPALHLSETFQAHIQPGTLVVVGETVCVSFDEQKIPWVVAGKTLSAPSFVSALPASPIDGQEIYFQNAAMAESGVVWTLRYRAASVSTHKWEFVGGSEMLLPGAHREEIYAAAEWKTMSAPTFTIPLAGDYEVAVEGTPAQSGGVGTVQVTTFTVGKVGSTANLGSIDYGGLGTTGAADSFYLPLTNLDRSLGRAAGDVIAPAAALASACTIVWYSLAMRVRPIRVG